MYGRYLAFLVFSFAIVVNYGSVSFPAYANAGVVSEATYAKQCITQGWQSFQRGALDEAVSSWLKAAQVYEHMGKPSAQSAALVQLAQAYQSLGQYCQALRSLECALAAAKKAGDRQRIAEAWGSLGNVYIVTGSVLTARCYNQERTAGHSCIQATNPSDNKKKDADHTLLTETESRYETARNYLKKGLHIAEEIYSDNLVATIQNNLGNLFFAQHEYDKALKAYTTSAEHAMLAGDLALAARAFTNAVVAKETRFSEKKKKLMLLVEATYLSNHPEDTDKTIKLTREIYELSKQLQEAPVELDKAMRLLKDVDKSRARAFTLIKIGLAYKELRALLLDAKYDARPRTHKMFDEEIDITQSILDTAVKLLQKKEVREKAFTLIKIALAYKELRPKLLGAKDDLHLRAYEAFNEAVDVAQSLGATRAESYAWGYLGTLYEEEQRYDEALQLTRRALSTARRGYVPESLFSAQQGYSPDLLYQWQWQQGRLHNAQGAVAEAIEAYRYAVNTLQFFRQEMLLGYGRHVSFRQTVRPIYLGLVDLLLRRAASLRNDTQVEPYLREARDVVESFRRFELREYFQDDCVDARQPKGVSLDDIVSESEKYEKEKVAFIYPIILPDRTELLVSLPARPTRLLKRYTAEVSRWSLNKEIRRFRHLLRDREDAHPKAQNFMQPAQQLYTWLMSRLDTDLADRGVKILVFVPDGLLRTIPMAALHDGKKFLVQRYALVTTPGLSLTKPLPLPQLDGKVLLAGLTESVRGFTALQHVAAEFKKIRELYRVKELRDMEFNLTNMEKIVQGRQFVVIHIATHGMFESDVGKTYLLTYDGKLTMKRLEELVGLFRSRDIPLELLTLSACNTAVGSVDDERAALGLIGVAIKAGARGALATLWSIDDEASAKLIGQFYQQLHQGDSRAKALQKAQLSLLNSNEKKHKHPFYWSPFLLLNNWL